MFYIQKEEDGTFTVLGNDGVVLDKMNSVGARALAADLNSRIEKSEGAHLNMLTSIQYCAVIIALNNAMSAAADGEFVDPYGENPDSYTNEDFITALKEAEKIIMHTYLPFIK